MNPITSLTVLDVTIRFPRILWIANTTENYAKITEHTSYFESRAVQRITPIEGIRCPFFSNLILLYDPDFIIFIEKEDSCRKKHFIDQILAATSPFEFFTELNPFLSAFRWDNMSLAEKDIFSIKRRTRKPKPLISNEKNLKAINEELFHACFNWNFSNLEREGIPLDSLTFTQKKAKSIHDLLSMKQARPLLIFNDWILDELRIEGHKGNELVLSVELPRRLVSAFQNSVLIADITKRTHPLRLPYLHGKRYRKRISSSGYSILHFGEWDFTKRKIIHLDLKSPRMVIRDQLDLALEQVGTVQASDKGIFAEELIREFGIEKVRETLFSEDFRKMLHYTCFVNTRKSPRQTNNIVLSTQKPELGYTEEDWKKTLEKMYKMRLLEQGTILYCPRCRSHKLYKLSEITVTFSCKRCNLTSEVNFAPEWAYSLKEAPFLAIINNCDVTLHAISALMKDLRLDTEQVEFETEIFYSGVNRFELDMIINVHGKLGIGESKISGDLVSKDINKLRKAIDILKPYYIIFASGRSCEKTNCNAIHSLSDFNFLPKILSVGTIKRIKEVKQYAQGVNPFCEVVIICGGGFFKKEDIFS